VCARLQGLTIPASAIGLPTSGAVEQAAVSVGATDAGPALVLPAPFRAGLLYANGAFCKVIGLVRLVHAGSPDLEFEVNLGGRQSSATSEQLEEVETPPACTEGFVQFAKQILSADRDTGLQIRWTNNRQRRLGHDQFDPKRIPAAEIRRRVRLAQCVHAGLFHSGGCFGETGQLKYHP
jgi:hypothetical protein